MITDRKTADVQVENHGSLFLLRAVTILGGEWLNEHLDPDGPRLGDAYAAEHRYIGAIVEGMLADGLEVRE